MRPQSGFSLLELAIAIVILAAILGTVMVPVATQVQVRKIKETEQLLEDAKEALLGFALSNRRLPCPDTDRDGQENPPAPGPGAPCSVAEGFLPWTALGLPPTDAWGRLFHYGVTLEFTQAQPPGTPCVPIPPGDGFMGLCDAGTNTITDTTRPPPNTLSSSAPAVVVSTGPNGWGGTELSGNVIATPANFGADETDNLVTTPTNQRFVLRPYFDDALPGCAEPACNFDDLVVWLSTPILFNRMVAAGRLP